MVQYKNNYYPVNCDTADPKLEQADQLKQFSHSIALNINQQQQFLAFNPTKPSPTFAPKEQLNPG